MSENNNLNQSFNSNSDNQSVSKTEINPPYNSDESKVQNPANLSAQQGNTSENLFPSIEQKESKSLSNSKEIPKNKNINWQKLAHKLREHNRKLLKTVFKLEQEVAETNNRIKEYTVRSQTTDMLIAQQAEEINHGQEEIANLIQELETSQQEVHKQKVIVDSLNKQIETANEQFAQLERQCASLQEKYNEQTHDLLTKTQQVEELSARLNRQQRYTLQYKAALDKYVDVASSSHISETKFDSDLLPTAPKPIQVWSKSQLTKETAKIKSSNLSLHQENYPLESELKLTSKNFQEANWPSPLITSFNHKKKHKSGAAIKLPKFQHSDSDNR